MKKLLTILTAISGIAQANAQYIHKIKADSVLITNDSCTAELNLENSTKHIKGFLYNKGNGRTEFRKAEKLNDSTFVFGEDTLVVSGVGNAWSIYGNTGTDTAVNFLGTIDSTAFKVRTNNKQVLHITPYNPNNWVKSNIGIGTSNPYYQYGLHINTHFVDPNPSIIPGITGGLLTTDEGSTRITAITAGSDFDRPYFTTVKANGTLTSPTSVTGNSRLGSILIAGYDGTGLVDAGELTWWVDGAVSTGIIPTSIEFVNRKPSGGQSRAMRLRSSGNLGIGNLSADFRLHAYIDSTNGIAAVNSSTLSATSGGFLHAYNLGTPASADLRLGGLIMGTNQSGTTYRASASITAFSEGAFTNGSSHPTYLTLSTTASGSNATAERLRITANGNIGIATTGPDRKLDILDTVAQLRLTHTDGSIYTDIQTNSNGIALITPTGPSTQVKTGAAGRYAGVGGTIADFHTDAGNSGSSVTDLYSYTVPANTMNNTDDKLVFKYVGTFANSTSERTLTVSFDGAEVFTTGEIDITETASWTVEGWIVRISNSTVRVYTEFKGMGPSFVALTNNWIELTSVSLDNTSILKITGQATGGAAASDHIIARQGTIEWKPAAIAAF